MIQPLPVLKWPDLKAIRTTEEDKKKIDDFISKVFSEPCSEAFKSFSKKERIVELPISLCFLYDSEKRVKHILLLLNKAHGKYWEGGQRKPKLVYDLLTGMFCIKKHLQNEEDIIVDHLHKHPQDYIVNILGTRIINGKRQYFEKAFDGTLKGWINTLRLQGSHNKLLTIRKLLVAFRNFHQLQVTKAFNDISFEHHSFHNDVKIDNILVNEGNDVALTDFGMANILPHVAYSPYYAHPIKITMKGWNARERADYMSRLGTKLDMWSLGIVFVVILTNRLTDRGVPELSFMDDIYDRKKHVKEAVTQERINAELLKFKRNTEFLFQGKLLNPLWDLVMEMVQLNTENIISVDQALDRVDSLIKESAKAIGPCLEVAERCEALKKELMDKVKEIRENR